MVVTVDFETEAIVANPVWKAPRPVGVAIHTDGEGSRYLAWGHPTGNNCTRDDAVQALRRVWDGPMLFHNAQFDLSVATQHLDLPWPSSPTAIHDTMWLLFLKDPYASTFALKPSAQRYLDLAPVERDDVRSWVLAHVPGATLRNFGAHISKTPGDLVGKYAIGDVVRTRQLFDLLYPATQQAPYEREQRLMPILCAASRRGIDIDTVRLASDAEIFNLAHSRATNSIFRLLGTEFNPDSDQDLIHVLEQADAVTEWHYTEKGNKSVARKSLHLREGFAELRSLLDYRGMLGTCLSTFVTSWLDLASEDGKVHPEWNSTRGERTKNDPNGTRTGRLSCSRPNFQNVPNGSDIKVPKGYPPLPVMRDYVLPPEGHVWLKRDFSAQEMRIMAHFAEGKLYTAYQSDPNIDPHQMVKELIYDLQGMDLLRKYVKITGFGIMYGMGIQKLADSMGIIYDEGAEIKHAYFNALPEVRLLSTAIRLRGRRGDPITTWGGRQYYREPHPIRDLSYKLLNYLIQGSAADQTKQAIIDWEASRKATDIFLATVHDEINIAAPIEDQAGSMFRLRVAMDADRFDVPFRSEGFAGPTWARLTEYEA